MSTPLVSDERIAKVMADQFTQSRDHVVACGAARAIRNIYEPELQSMRDRLSRMEEAGNAMAKQMKFWADYMGETDNQRGEEMVTKTITQWNAALSNK